ncbi:MAG: DUF4339 domain-containing protein [Proteobacteria bacterium]|nr:DUF4339 domain-containing protein [Pseudomonadota bacterium]
MAEEWYILGEDQQKLGPLLAEQLQQYAADGAITGETLLWTERLEEWVPASTVEGLFAVAQTVPVPPVGVTNSGALGGGPNGLLDPAYYTTARGLRLIYLGVLLSFIAGVVGVLTSILLPNVPANAVALLGSASVACLCVIQVCFLMKLIGFCMGFGAPQDSSARLLLGGALCVTLLPVLLALFGYIVLWDYLDALLGGTLGLIPILAGIIGLMAFIFALALSQIATEIPVMILMDFYMKRIATCIGLPLLNTQSLLKQLFWMLRILGTASLCVLLAVLFSPVFLLFLYICLPAFCIQYIVIIFSYLGLLAEARQAIISQQQRVPRKMGYKVNRF